MSVVISCVIVDINGAIMVLVRVRVRCPSGLVVYE